MAEDLQTRARAWAIKHQSEIVFDDAGISLKKSEELDAECYRAGAEDQRKIDIEKACKWLLPEILAFTENWMKYANNRGCLRQRMTSCEIAEDSEDIQILLAQFRDFMNE